MKPGGLWDRLGALENRNHDRAVERREVRAARPRTGVTVVGVILIVLVLWAGYHVVHAEMTKSAPPVSCQLLGGQWNIWNGWVCG